MTESIRRPYPPHLYLDQTWYLITAAIWQRRPLLAPTAHAGDWIAAIPPLLAEFEIRLRAWVVLPDHYHVLLRTGAGRMLPLFMQRLHGRTARTMNQQDGTLGRQVWSNYWDTCLRSEASIWTRFNYIHNNPVKHGYASDASTWAYSSYSYYQRTRGSEWLADVWARYPVVDYLNGDDFP